MTLLLTTAGISISIFFVAWLWATKIKNVSIVDAVWALAFTPVAACYAYLGEGWIWRRIAIAGIITLWSLRLCLHLSKRIYRLHPKEESRYLKLREIWTREISFLYFFQAQALLVWLLMLPVYLICRNETLGFQPIEIAGLALWMVGVIGEAIADHQLRKFAAGPNSKTTVCQEGLWKYSRHPNYFFQSLIWWGLFLIALATPLGWWTILAPLAMLFTLLRVTGIPLTEEISLEKRGEPYREYQRTTSPFLPLPPKKT